MACEKLSVAFSFFAFLKYLDITVCIFAPNRLL